MMAMSPSKYNFFLVESQKLFTDLTVESQDWSVLPWPELLLTCFNNCLAIKELLLLF